MSRFCPALVRSAPLLALAIAPATFAGGMPPMGGPMRHIEVSLNGTAVELMLEDPGPLALVNYGETYEDPASALNGYAFNSQYGWMAGGFWSLPPGALVWVELLDATPGLRSFEAMTYAPIFGTEDSSLRWQWSGIMVHNWYAVAVPGEYEATYRVYVGDAESTPLDEYESADVTLTWSAAGRFGDLDGDNAVGASDLAVLLGAWATAAPNADLDADGTIGAADLALLLGAWGS